MITGTTDDLLIYLADLIETVERFGAVVLPPNDGDDVAWEQDGADLTFELATRLPVERRSRDVDLVFAERWKPGGRGWELVEFGYELLHRELDYRRALHRHDEAHFVESFDVVTHEHCEATMEEPVCRHFYGEPVSGAIDGFYRLYGLWLTDRRPDCAEVRCLE